MNYQIHQIKGYIQTIYLVQEKVGLFLMDGCCRPDVEKVEEFITKELGMSIKDLKLVISTHAHPDHAGGLADFRKRGVKIVGPKELNDWYGGILGFFTYWIDILLTYLVAVNKKRGIKNILFPRNVKLYLYDGDMVPGFENWKILESHGHTNVDLSIFHEKDKLAYVADNFVGNKRNVFRPYPIFAPEKYKKTLQRYIDLNIERFLLAHHGEVRVSHERINKLIEGTSLTPRRHLNTLPAIFLKLLRSFIRKI